MSGAKGFVTATCLALIPALSHAQPWSGDIALGYLATTGNSETSSVNAKGALIFAAERWKNTATFNAVNTYADGQNSAESYIVTEQLDYNFTPHDYAFVSVEWNKDRFAPVRERTSETLGYGRHVLTGPVHVLDLEVGAGARQSQINEQPRYWEDDAIWRAAAKYQWALSPTSSFQQTLKVESGDANTYTESMSALKLAVIGNIYANLSYTVKNNTKTADDTKKTDTQAAVTLSYEFGKTPPPPG